MSKMWQGVLEEEIVSWMNVHMFLNNLFIFSFKDHMWNAHDNFEMSEAEIDAMFIKNKNEIKRMEAELGNSKSIFISEVVEEEIIEEHYETEELDE